MRNFVIIPLVLLLTACVAVPVERKFPTVPEVLTQQCGQLEEVPVGTTKLSDILIVVTNNYALYHECQLKVETWNEWYNTQKKIYEK